MPAQQESYTIDSGEVLSGGRYHFGYVGEVAKSLAAGAFAELTTNVNEFETSGPSGTPRTYMEGEVNYPLSNWPGKIAFHRAKKRLVGIGTTNGYIGDLGVHSKRISFDMTTGMFDTSWNPLGVSYGHFYDTNCSRDLNGTIYARGYAGASIYGMDPETNAWSARFSLSGLSAGTTGANEVFPSLGASGSVLWLESTGRLVRFNVADGARTVIGTYTGVGNYPVIHYVPALDCVVFGGGEAGTSFYKLNSSGVVSQISTTLPVQVAANGSGGPFVPDPSGKPSSLLFYGGDSIIRRVDWTTGEWEEIGLPATWLQGKFALTLAASITDLKSIALLTYSGRVGGVTQSKVHLYKVPQ